MNAIESSLMKGEQIVAAGRVSIAPVWPALIAAVASASFAAFSFAIGENVAGIVCSLVAFFSLAIALHCYFERITTEYGCTDRRVVIKSGLLSTQIREMPLGKVEAIVVNRPLIGRLLGYGTVVVKGSGGTRRTFGRIEGPEEFARCVRDCVDHATRPPRH